MLIQAAAGVILLCGITSCVESAQTVEETLAAVDTLLQQNQLRSHNRKQTDAFKQYIGKYERIYATDEEVEKRFEIFQKTGKRQHENYGVGWKSDMTKEEVLQRTGLLLTKEDWTKIKAKIEADKPIVARIVSKITGEPEYFDFREKYPKYVSPIADQGFCAACWAFAFTAQLESKYAKEHDKQAEPLSKSELQECTGRDNCTTGGNFDLAVEYTVNQEGLLYEREYSYRNSKSQMHECARTIEDEAEVTIVGYIAMTNDATEMKKILYEEGPIIVYINSNFLQRNNYSIIRKDDINCCPEFPDGSQSPYYDAGNTNIIDHSVVLVGYGVEDGVPYWIIRNSHGPTFGKDGYHRIERGTNACGIEMVGYLVLPNGTRRGPHISDFHKITFLVCTLFKYVSF
ncbi:hypothetical protein WDU94_007637 [Cyamophila willieti]